MKRFTIAMVMIVWFAAIFGLAILNLELTPTVRAQELPVLMVENPQQEGTADWTISDMTFESNYPIGFTFKIKASSSGGAITRARALWYSPLLRPSETRNIQAQEGEFDPETGLWTATWEASAIMMVPPWVELMFHWELKDAAGNSFETEPTIAEYADNTREWTRSESDAATVFTFDLGPEVKETVLDAIAQQQPQYEAVWGAPLPRKPRVVLFGSLDAWMEWRTVDDNAEESMIIGQTFDQWNAVEQVLFGGDMDAAIRELAYSTVVHEIEHLYQAEYVWSTRDVYDIPSWFMEGDATFFELEQSYDYLGKVQEMAANDVLPPLLVDPADAPRTDGDNARDGYDIGYTFIVWLREQGGVETHHQVMKLLADDVPFFSALEQVTGMSKEEIEVNWRTWLGASPYAATLIPTWTPAFPVIATPQPGG